MVGSNTFRSTFKLKLAIVTHITMTTPTRINSIPSRRSIMEQRKKEQEQQTSIEVAKDDSLEVEDLNDRSGSPTSIKSFPFDEQNKHTEGKKLVFQQQQQQQDDDNDSTNPQDVEEEVEEDVEEEEVAVVAQPEGEDKSQFAEASLADETTAFMTNLSPKEGLNTSITEAGEEIILEEETDDEIELEAKQEKDQEETLLNTVNEEDQEGPEEDQELETENEENEHEAKIVEEAETEGKVQRTKEQDEHDLVSVENSIQVDGLPPPPQDDSENLPKRITKSIFGRCGIGLPDEREWPKSKREWWNLVLDTTEDALETFGGENWDDPWYENQKGRRRRRSRRNDDRRRSRSEHRNRGTRTSKRASSVDSAMPEIVIPKDTRTQLV